MHRPPPPPMGHFLKGSQSQGHLFTSLPGKGVSTFKRKGRESSNDAAPMSGSHSFPFKPRGEHKHQLLRMNGSTPQTTAAVSLCAPCLRGLVVSCAERLALWRWGRHGLLLRDPPKCGGEGGGLAQAFPFGLGSGGDRGEGARVGRSKGATQNQVALGRIHLRIRFEMRGWSKGRK